MIGIVGVAGLTLTGAYFSDTETSTNNIMQAGSLDLILNGVNGDPVVALVDIKDMKPSLVQYSAPIKLHITNNPGKIYKKISINGADCVTVTTTEPECTAEGGTWNYDDGSTVEPDCSAGTGTWTPQNDLFPVTYFDLAIWKGDGIPNEDQNLNPDPICDDDSSSTPVTTNCWETLIPDDVITINGIANKQIYLGGEDGSYDAGSTIIIRQSFHMKGDADNKYQSDSCTFTEEFMVVQTNAPHPADYCDPAVATGGANSCY